MRPFVYARPGSVEDAAKLGAVAGARFIAGGTNLLDLMKLEIETPERLVDISRLELGGIKESGGGLRIGATATNSDVAADVRVRSQYPMLARAILAGASAQIRNKASVGGNLLQRTRCFYFYDTAAACNKRKPGSGCAALEGFNRIHAVLGASEACIATHPSDMAVALLALDASVVTNRRTLKLAELYRTDAPHLETVLETGELITGVELPAPLRGEQSYRKVRDRASYAFALVSVAAAVSVEGGKIAAAALAFGGLAPKPWRDAEVEATLVGKAPTVAVFAAAADVLLKEARGRGHNDFKIPLVKRTLMACLKEATS